VIRTALFAAVILAAASPALAFERASVPAPKQTAGAHFLNFGGVAKLLPDSAAEPFRFGEEQRPKGETFIVEVGKGKATGRLDVNDARQNAFMAGRGRKAPVAPAH
jgi:hypothetical protein